MISGENQRVAQRHTDFLTCKKRRYMLRVFCEGNAFTIEYRLRRKLCMETRSNASYKPLFYSKCSFKEEKP